MANAKKIVLKSLKVFGKILLGILILLILIILFIRSEWGQNLIVDKFISDIEERSGAEIDLGRVFIEFNGDIAVEDLFIKTPAGDTLVYSEDLSASIALLPIIKQEKFHLKDLDWKNLKAKITRKDTIEGFNFAFLMAPADTTQTQTPADTTTTAMAIELGDFDLQNIDVIYDDKVTGIDSRFKFDLLQAEFSRSDLDSMLFDIDRVYLKNAAIALTQNESQSTDTTSSTVPNILFKDLKIENSNGFFESNIDSMYVDYDIDLAEASNARLNLPETAITANRFLLDNSLVVVKMKETQAQAEPSPEPEGFPWPEIYLDFEDLDFKNSEFQYSLNGAEPENGTFNPNALFLSELNITASKFHLEEGEATANISELRLKEGSGLLVNQFAGDIQINEDKMDFDLAKVQINNNQLQGEIIIDYQDLNSFMSNPGSAQLVGNIGSIRADLRDVFRFQPDLRNNQYMAALAKSPVYGSASFNGTIDNINISNGNFRWKDTRITGIRGAVRNSQDPDNLTYRFPGIKVVSTRSNLLNFVSEQDLGMRLPENVELAGSFSGGTESLETNAKLITSDGNISVDGQFEFADQIAFDASIQGDSISLGSLLQNEFLGPLSININASGSGSTINDLDAELNSQITSFSYKDYQFKDIFITGNLEKGEGPIELIYQDANLDLDAQTIVHLDSVKPSFDFLVFLDGANLGELNITKKEIKTGFELEGNYSGNSEEYTVHAELKHGVAVLNNKSYLFGDLTADAFVRSDTTSVNIDNQIIDIDMQSNATPASFISALERHYRRYITEDYQQDSLVNPVKFRMNGEIRQAPILTEVFLVNLEELDTVKIDVDFQEAKRELTAMVSIPRINYFSSEIDSLLVEVSSDDSDLYVDFGFKAIKAGPLDIKRTKIDGVVVDRKLNIEFNSEDEEGVLAHMNSQINFQGDTLKFKVEPKGLVLNRNDWNVNPNNLMSYDTGYLEFKDFVFDRSGQRVALKSGTTDDGKDRLSMDFENFTLEALLNYLNPENQLAEGSLNGELVYEDPFGETGLLADLAINQFKILNTDLGDLTIKGESAGFNTYDFEMAMKGGEIDMDLTGEYVAAQPSAKLDMNLDLNRVNMAALDSLSLGQVQNGSGSFSGNFSVTGTVVEPEYSGELNFDNAGFNLAMLNADFLIADETLNLDNNGVYFDNFNIQDSNNNEVTINGDIITDDLLNPKFDLAINADNFQLLNSTEEDNDLFYGSAFVDVDAQISGDLNLPEVQMNLTVNENTDFTYVVPENELQIQDRDGVVIFVNKEDPNNILTQREEESYVVSGYSIDARLTVQEGAKFTMVISEETGDRFVVQGEGDLLFDMYPNGRISLSGTYNVNDGFYEMSLYNLVSRRFDISDGSRVSWAGDPFDAQLDVRAIYRVETSASALMATRVAGSDQGTMDQFKKKLPFLVYLNIDGQLMEPKITFNLDMPEDERGEGGGEVYGTIQQLNNQEQELNKQVFSLLVLNRFFPGSGSDGSSGGTLAVARDNLNNALSDQLNALSGKILGESGINLSFDVDSYTDYQGENAQERTQLGINAEKAFMDDRLVVQVGSEVDIQGGNQPGQQAAPVIGNVSIAYLLDEDGVWRIKGFRRNRFENVIDGQLIVSGISLIFTKEFNKFKNLFAKAVATEVEEQNSEGKEENTQSEEQNTQNEEN